MTLVSKSTKKSIIIIISGPSGVGKDTILKQIKKNTNLYFPVTVTTRTARKNEKNGIDYKFIQKHLFNKMIQSQEFIEWAKVYEYYYGVPKNEIDYAKNNQLDIILKTDIQGAFTIKKLEPTSKTIFISPPNIKELSIRLKNRSTEDKISLEKRLQTSEYEISQSSKFDYNIVNETKNVAKTINRILNIINIETRNEFLNIK